MPSIPRAYGPALCGPVVRRFYHSISAHVSTTTVLPSSFSAGQASIPHPHLTHSHTCARQNPPGQRAQHVGCHHARAHSVTLSRTQARVSQWRLVSATEPFTQPLTILQSLAQPTHSVCQTQSVTHVHSPIYSCSAMAHNEQLTQAAENTPPSLVRPSCPMLRHDDISFIP